MVAREMPGGVDNPLDAAAAITTELPSSSASGVKVEAPSSSAAASGFGSSVAESAAQLDADVDEEEEDYESEEGVSRSCRKQLGKLRTEWLASGSWPAETAAGGNAACVAALKTRAKYMTFAASPAPGAGKIGLSGGNYGPFMKLYCWGGGRISLVGLPDVPEDLGADSLKDDLTLNQGTMELVRAEEAIIREKDDSNLLNARGQLFHGFHRAAVRLLAPGQSFKVRDVTEFPRNQTTRTITTEPGDLELTLYLQAIDMGRYPISHLMRLQRERTMWSASDSLEEVEDEATVKRTWSGFAGDWFGSGLFG